MVVFVVVVVVVFDFSVKYLNILATSGIHQVWNVSIYQYLVKNVGFYPPGD